MSNGKSKTDDIETEDVEISHAKLDADKGTLYFISVHFCICIFL